MPKKPEPKVPVLVEDDSWSMHKAKDPFWSEPDGAESAPSTVKRLLDKVTKRS